MIRLRPARAERCGAATPGRPGRRAGRWAAAALASTAAAAAGLIWTPAGAPAAMAQPTRTIVVACSQDALIRAVLLAPPNAILVLQKGCTYNISELMPINQNMTIEGNGDTIDATALAFTAFWNFGVNFTVEHLTIRHGVGDRIRAGAIQNDPGGNVTITDCTFTKNLGGAGGALINLPGATMTVTNSSFTDNDAYDAGGGAIANFGTMTVSGSDFTGNSAIYDPLVPPLPKVRSAARPAAGPAKPAEETPGDGTGGAIGNFGGDLTLSGPKSTFTDNHAGAGGGAIGNFGRALGQPVDDVIRADAPVAPTGRISVTNAIFTGNQADGDGGAIANTGTTSTVANSGFTGNTAGGSGGAIATTTSLSLPGDNISRNRAARNGGGIFASGGNTTLDSNTTVTSNTAGGTGGGIDVTRGTVSLTDGVLVLLNRPNNCTGVSC